MEPPPSLPNPLVERVAIAHRYVSQLVDELLNDPPTPGVVETLRSSLSNEIDRGAQALVRVAAGHGGRQEDLDRHLGVAASLAAMIDPGRGVDVREVARAVEQHLSEERQLAAHIAGGDRRSAALQADEYSQMRDQLVYGL